MTSERWEQISTLFEATLEQPTDRQSDFLAQACGDDNALRHEVLALLHAHAKSKTFIETPVASPVTALLVESAPELSQIDPLIGKNLQHYRVLARLGAGGMGIVYRALDTHLDRFVAI